MPESDKPSYVYKIVPSSSTVPIHDPDLPDRLPVSTIDQNSGFIHLSTSVQIPGTLKFFFKDDHLVYILRIKYNDLEDQIRWEDPKAEVCGSRGGEGMFPHLYNGLKLGREEIDLVKTLENGEGGWDASLEKAFADWLVW